MLYRLHSPVVVGTTCCIESDISFDQCGDNGSRVFARLMYHPDSKLKEPGYTRIGLLRKAATRAICVVSHGVVSRIKVLPFAVCVSTYNLS